jgi:GT2 family glycosyltransferase
MADRQVATVAIVIVGFRNSADIKRCLHAVRRTAGAPSFDVFICENGGTASYHSLVTDLLAADGPCMAPRQGGCGAWETSRLGQVERLELRTRRATVWVGCAADNLGYAGGINAWLSQLLEVRDWTGVWILNPDTEPAPSALAALIRYADITGKGMIGSTILDAGQTDRVRIRGGIHWQRLLGRCVSLGRDDPMQAVHDLKTIESTMDSPSGCSMYITRQCIERIGLMDERYFLFFEDLDWGMRAKPCGLGYASDSHVEHQRGTTTGSARTLSAIPKLSVYLEHRNSVHFVRRYFAWSLPIRIAASLLYSFRFLIAGAPHNCAAALQGLAAGLKGEVGRPTWHRDP